MAEPADTLRLVIDVPVSRSTCLGTCLSRVLSCCLGTCLGSCLVLACFSFSPLLSCLPSFLQNLLDPFPLPSIWAIPETEDYNGIYNFVKNLLQPGIDIHSLLILYIEVNAGMKHQLFEDFTVALSSSNAKSRDRAHLFEFLDWNQSIC